MIYGFTDIFDIKHVSITHLPIYHSEKVFSFSKWNLKLDKVYTFNHNYVSAPKNFHLSRNRMEEIIYILRVEWENRKILLKNIWNTFHVQWLNRLVRDDLTQRWFIFRWFLKFLSFSNIGFHLLKKSAPK